MAVLMKWNYDKHDYDMKRIPDGMNCVCYSGDMDKVVNCATCFREIRYGDGYGSLEVHDGYGFGYCVCESCYEAELELRRKYRD